MTKKNKSFFTRRALGNHQFPIALSDMMTLLVMVIWYMFAAAVIYIAPPTQDKNPPLHVPPGVVQVLVFWPDVGQPGGCADVDTWMQSPYDVAPVGFASPKGEMTDLMRDDLGCINNPLGKNFEEMQTHGVPAGEYIVNLHYYFAHSETVPIPVHIIGEVILPDSSGHNNETLIFDEWVTLKKTNDAATVAIFDLDAKGKLLGLYHYPKFIIPESIRNESAAIAEASSGSTGVH